MFPREKSFKIKAIATPKNTDEKITFKSSNKKVATVTSKGVVKGLKKGTATIDMGFIVNGREELHAIIEKLRQLQGVLDIERTTG